MTPPEIGIVRLTLDAQLAIIADAVAAVGELGRRAPPELRVRAGQLRDLESTIRRALAVHDWPAARAAGRRAADLGRAVAQAALKTIQDEIEAGQQRPPEGMMR